MIKLKTEEEIELLRENALLVSKTLAEVGKHVAPGVTTLELNKIAETFIRDHGAVPAFLGYNGFPYALCMSVNDVVVHGFASDYHLQEGDIVSVDCGTILKGFYGDSAYTFPVGKVSEETAKLLEVTKESLYRGISMAVAGNRIGDISNAIQTY
ncbi:MAG: type I methionyl aminopeptidase, partial [Bacteroidia bacterium]|nr:type I methionyl aminopeptidase [Bacteroidia bacterium]